MYQFPIGVIVDSFRVELSSAIKQAAAIGAKGIQMYSTYGDHAPENLSAQARKDLLREVKDQGMVFSALCGDLGHSFTNPELNPELIERSKRIVDLALELETNVVTTHVGVVPDDPNCDTYKIMQDAAGTLAAYADSVNAHFAIETGPEKAVVLRGFLDSLHSTGVAVNLDPANLTMCVQDDAVQAVYTLKDYIVHTHAKDGISLVGGSFPLNSEAAIQAAAGERWLELPLGQGGVDWPNYLKALEEIGFRGFLTIEREAGDDPAADIKIAHDFLKQVMA